MNQIMSVTAGGAGSVGHWLAVQAMVISLDNAVTGLALVRATGP